MHSRAVQERKVKGLIIADPWIGYIISGTKTWEMRSRNTTVRGRIGLIRKGSKTVVGVADLVGTLPKLSLSDLTANIGKHQVSASEIDDKFKHNTAWVLQRAEQLRQPVPFRFPVGSVIWVNLDPAIAAMIERQLGGNAS
jgi:hypothetical protein